MTIFATGSEVEIAVKAREALTAEGIAARVVSVPCFELFDEQPEEYQKAIIGNSPVKIAIEAGSARAGTASSAPTAPSSACSRFGASGPYKDLYKHFGITPRRWSPRRKPSWPDLRPARMICAPAFYTQRLTGSDLK